MEDVRPPEPGAAGNPYGLPCLSTEQVIKELAGAVTERRGWSLVRFGHGELFAVGHLRWPERFDPGIDFLGYAGLTRADESSARLILDALFRADLVGLIQRPRPFEAPLTRLILSHYRLGLTRFCDAWVTHDMARSEEFYDALGGRRAVLVGRRAVEGRPLFEERGIRVVATLPLEGLTGLEGALGSLRTGPDFDVALLAAGIPATVLAPRAARVTGRPVVDFGHALDKLLDGDDFDHERLVDRYNRSHPQGFTGALVLGRGSPWKRPSRS